MAGNDYVVNKMPENGTFTVKVGRGLKLRIKLGLFFLKIAARILNANIEVVE